MNRGVLQSSPVQQMMVGGNRNPSCWWNVNTASLLLPQPPPSPNNTYFPHQLMPATPPPPPPLFPPSTTVASSSSWHGEFNYHQDQLLTAESWSQLLLDEEDKSGSDELEKKLENWDQEQASNNLVYRHGVSNNNNNNWSQMVLLSASPKSSTVTNSMNNNMLNFSSNKPDRSSECNSSTTMGGVAKKARVQPSSSPQATFKVRKEKLGDRITALHQIVSPFGKTDTASVLLEAIGYIRFLQGQIEALSLPYLATAEAAAGSIKNQHSGESELCDGDEIIVVKKDLKSRGLCLMPVSCTIMQVESGADYWTQAIAGAGNFQQNM